MTKVEKSEKTIYLIRHGQSEGNIFEIYQPPDSPLTKIGKKQASHVANRISKLSFETLISSSLSRAKETTETIMALTGKTPEYSDLFAERAKPTNIYGKPYKDNKANQLYRKWIDSLFHSEKRAEDGENFDDLIARADDALDFLSGRDEQTIVVVTHGFFIRTLMIRAVLGRLLTPEVYKSFQTNSKITNASISMIKYNDGEWQLCIYNDHAHLG